MSELLAAAEREVLEKAVGHHFDDPGLLETALTRASYADERGAGRGNERLEFLGDAVVGLVVARLLFEAHPDWAEGELTRARAALVNRAALAERGRQLELGRYARQGRSERLSGGAENDRVLANCFEALLGAIFLDAGLAPVEALSRRLFGEAVADANPAPRDPKTEFQEWAHAHHGVTPRYRTTRDSEVNADPERFGVEVCVGEEVFGAGSGASKREAERSAARRALAAAAGADGES